MIPYTIIKITDDMTKRDSIFPQYDFHSKYFRYNNYVIHYLDEGKGNPMILLHGNPTWSFLYRKMIPILARKFRVIVPDLLGFGLSSKPKNSKFYTFENHFLAISALLDSLKLKNAIVVGQDWGGLLLSFYAIKHTQQIKGIVLMNTYIPGMSLKIPFYFSFLFRSMYSRFLIQDIDLFRILAFRFGFSTRIPKDVRKAYLYPHRKKEDRVSIVAFPKLIPSGKAHPTYEFLQEINREFAKWQAPKLFIFSDKDIVFKRRNSEALSHNLPHTTYLLIKNAGHYLQEDKGEEIAEHILSFFQKSPN